MCISPLLSGLSLCLSVPFSPLSFHLHFSFVERNSRLLARTIARPLAYESNRGAASEAGKREGRRVIKLPNQSQADIRTLISLMLMRHIFPSGKSFILIKNRVSLLFLFCPCAFIHGHYSVLNCSAWQCQRVNDNWQAYVFSPQRRLFNPRCPNLDGDIACSLYTSLRHKINQSKGFASLSWDLNVVPNEALSFHVIVRWINLKMLCIFENDCPCKCFPVIFGALLS